MAKFGSFKYGGGAAGAKYGPSDTNEYLTWYFGVFWDDEFIDEESRMIDLQIDRGRDHFLSTSGGWERFRAGEASALFDNEDGRFDFYNASSPLFGLLLPGRVVRISVTQRYGWSSVETTFDVMRGIITDIQNFLRSGQRTARIVVKDGLEWLTRKSVSLPLVTDEQAMITAEDVAQLAGFDTVDDWSISILGTDSVVIPYAWFNSNRAIDIINQLADAEIGQVFHSKSGVLTLVCGDYTDAGTTEITNVETLRDMEVKAPWEVVRTRAQITANPRAEGAEQVLWSYGVDSVATWDAATEGTYPTSPYLSAFYPTEDIIIDASFGETTFVAPPTVDWDSVQGVPARAFLTWVDYSGVATLSTTDIGSGLRLTFNGPGGTVGGNPTEFIVLWVEITATPLEASDPVTMTTEDTGATATYGEKTFELNSPWIQSADYAQAYADYVVAQLADASRFVTIQIEKRGLLQFTPELYVDEINLVIPTLGIDDTFRVGKISHKWLSPNGLAVRTTLRLEPYLGPH